jgi:glycerophosphoryl diester phosphodiesterase
VIIIALVVLLLLWRYALWSPRDLPGVTRTPPYLLGHRGTRGDGLPAENTLAAFEYAFEAGLDGIECDVQQTYDKALVLFHDFDVQQREVATMTLTELRALEPDVPTLEAFLELASHYPGTLLNIEIKSATPHSNGLERAVTRAVRASGLSERVIISSFNPVSLLRVRLWAPELRVGLLYAPDLPWYLRGGQLAPWLHVDALHPHESQVTAELIAYARARRLMLNTWTVNDPMRICSLYTQKIDAIIGDNPALLITHSRRQG